MKNAYTLREKATARWMRRTLREMAKMPKDLKEGDKVTFNPEWIANSPFYKQMNAERREFVQSHKDEVFTLAYDEGKEGSSSLFVFEEDMNETKYLWHASELKKVEVEE